MTIDEAINMFVDMSDTQKAMAVLREDEYSEFLLEEGASRFAQVAEWLRELKAYKDFENKGYVMCRFEVAQDDRHRTTKMVLDFSTKELFDNIVEVNADERR